MVGVLIEIGEGKRKGEDILNILEAKDRRKAGITANPEGLYLRDVYYNLLYINCIITNLKKKLTIVCIDSIIQLDK